METRNILRALGLLDSSMENDLGGSYFHVVKGVGVKNSVEKRSLGCNSNRQLIKRPESSNLNQNRTPGRKIEEFVDAKACEIRGNLCAN